MSKQPPVIYTNLPSNLEQNILNKIASVRNDITKIKTNLNPLNIFLYLSLGAFILIFISNILATIPNTQFIDPDKISEVPISWGILVINVIYCSLMGLFLLYILFT